MFKMFVIGLKEYAHGFAMKKVELNAVRKGILGIEICVGLIIRSL